MELVFYLTGGTFLDLKKQSVSFGDIAKRVAATKPHLVAFSSVTDNYRMQLNCAQEIKKILPDVTTIFGGVHPTLVPELVLKEKSIDAIAIGEAEISFLAFLDECRVSGGRLIFPKFPVNGIIFKREGDIIGDAREGELADIDTLAFVYKKKFYQSFRSFSYAYTTITSRGCPYICSYCFHSHLYSLRGKTAFRQRKVGNIISEILQAKRDYAPRYIWFAFYHK
ncbi:MAG: cobalamin-dependent protein [Candidatus Omnitrophica bacterium]|nr:cobalamin-dependent protein [Candidatus Omnitrophota bacterium]